MLPSLTLALLLGFLPFGAWADLFTPPSGEPVCEGLLNSGPGGMFGYSIALSSGEAVRGANLTWMAIGKPWDCSVHIYVIRNPDLAAVTSNRTRPTPSTGTTDPLETPEENAEVTAGMSAAVDEEPETVGNVTVADRNRIPIGQWSPVQLLGDTNNGTYPARAYSLFGYSLAFTDDGSWLAVGIPGRSYVPLTQAVQLQSHSYSGAVRIYRRTDSPAAPVSPNTPYVFMGEIPNPNGGDRFWDKFGSKVQWQSVFDAAVNQTKTYLFVVANAGWDGATTKFFQAYPDTAGWPVQPTTDVRRAGVYIYQLAKPTQIAPPTTGALVSSTGVFRYRQFLRQQSTVPLGSLGIDIETLVRSSLSNPATQELVLLVRDFVVVPSQMESADEFLAACPSGACSYIEMNVDGSQKVINGTGVVIEYRLDYAVGKFVSTDEELSSLQFYRKVVQSPLSNFVMNDGYPPDSWERNDWFGVGLSAAYDAKYERYMMAVGAPRDASGLYTFHSKPLDSDGTAVNAAEKGEHSRWKMGQYLLNENYYRRSFFGQKTAFSPDGRFLVVADPSGSGTSLGRGNVYLYYRRSESEFLVPEEYNSVIKGEIRDGFNMLSPYHFDRLSQFSKTPEPKTNFTAFQADHFGFGLAVNKYFVTIGSPLDQCVYTYALPVVVEDPVADPTLPDGPGNYTIIRPTSTSNTTQPNPESSTNQAVIYGIIGGVSSLLLVLPLVWYILKKQHQKRVLKELNEMKALGEMAESEEALATRAGTQENLAATAVVQDSTTTLNRDVQDAQE